MKYLENDINPSALSLVLRFTGYLYFTISIIAGILLLSERKQLDISSLLSRTYLSLGLGTIVQGIIIMIILLALDKLLVKQQIQNLYLEDILNIIDPDEESDEPEETDESQQEEVNAG